MSQAAEFGSWESNPKSVNQYKAAFPGGIYALLVENSEPFPRWTCFIVFSTDEGTKQEVHYLYEAKSLEDAKKQTAFAAAAIIPRLQRAAEGGE